MREASLTLAVVLGVQLHVTDASTYALEPGTGDPILWREGTLQNRWRQR